MKADHDALMDLRSGKKPAQHSGDYWSEEDKQKLHCLFMEGCRLSEIALELNRTERGIVTQLDRAGLLAPQARPRGRRNQHKCLCPNCAVVNCQNCGKECGNAGDIR